jgi:hypothetical protein
VGDKDKDYERDEDNDERTDVEPDCVGDRSVLTLHCIYGIIQFLMTIEY